MGPVWLVASRAAVEPRDKLSPAEPMEREWAGRPLLSLAGPLEWAQQARAHTHTHTRRGLSARECWHANTGRLLSLASPRGHIVRA